MFLISTYSLFNSLFYVVFWKLLLSRKVINYQNKTAAYWKVEKLEGSSCRRIRSIKYFYSAKKTCKWLSLMASRNVQTTQIWLMILLNFRNLYLAKTCLENLYINYANSLEHPLRNRVEINYVSGIFSTLRNIEKNWLK